jgi:hypothetical protein
MELFICCSFLLLPLRISFSAARYLELDSVELRASLEHWIVTRGISGVIAPLNLTRVTSCKSWSDHATFLMRKNGGTGLDDSVLDDSVREFSSPLALLRLIAVRIETLGNFTGDAVRRVFLQYGGPFLFTFWSQRRIKSL